MTQPVMHLIVGPERHGVVRFGVALHAALRASGFPIEYLRAPDLPSSWRGVVPAGRGVHLQFTDRLFGADAPQAVAAVCDLAAEVRRGGGRITATLHDLPLPSDRANFATRGRAYASLCTVLDAVAVSSDHERVLLSDLGVASPATVIPLPIDPPAPGRPTPGLPSSVAVFGFLYPDKGHADVLAAMEGLAPDIGLMAIGEPSAGHDDLVGGLDRDARAQRRSFTVTGHVPDDALVTMLQAVAVPVVCHRHVSASGSLNSWLAAGRRPLVPATRYAREIAQRNPGALWLYDDDHRSLSATIRAALDDPTSTWLPRGLVCSPSPEQAADGYRRLLRSVHDG